MANHQTGNHLAKCNRRSGGGGGKAAGVCQRADGHPSLEIVSQSNANLHMASLKLTWQKCNNPSTEPCKWPELPLRPHCNGSNLNSDSNQVPPNAQSRARIRKTITSQNRDVNIAVDAFSHFTKSSRQSVAVQRDGESRLVKNTITTILQKMSTF